LSSLPKVFLLENNLRMEQRMGESQVKEKNKVIRDRDEEVERLKDELEEERERVF
jgi:hypothetical protein